MYKYFVYKSIKSMQLSHDKIVNSRGGTRQKAFLFWPNIFFEGTCTLQKFSNPVLQENLFPKFWNVKNIDTQNTLKTQVSYSLSV